MEIIDCKFFLIPKPMKKHLYLLLFLFGALLRILIIYIFKRLKNDENESNGNNNENHSKTLNQLLTKNYFEIINNVLSALFLGIPHFFNRMINKDENKYIYQQTYNTNSQKIDFINCNDNNQPNRPLLVIKIIFIISTVDIICQLLIPINYIIGDKSTEDHSHLYFLLFFDIFARYLFSRWILKAYFYIHHKLSFLLNIVGLIPITIVDIYVKILKKKEYNSFYVCIVSIRVVLYSFEDIMNKVAYIYLSILPCSLLFYNGLFMLCYFIIISILFFLFGLYDFKNNFDIFFQIKYSLCYIPFNILRNYYINKVIDTFSAQYIALLRVTEAIIIFSYNNISKYFTINNNNNNLTSWQIIIQYIGFFLLLISSLIHNEIIIINHPKLKAKTKYFLDMDADREQISSINSSLFSKYTSSSSITDLYDSLTGSDIS